MKASTSSGGVKNMLLQHVEKMVLGVAAILVALFLWSAMGVKPIDASKAPDKLVAAAKSETLRIDESTAPPPPPPAPRFETAVVAGLDPVAIEIYSHPQKPNPELQPPIVKRPDPKALPAENVLATPVIVSIPEVGLAPTWKDEEDEKTKKAAKKKAEPRPNIEGTRGPRRRARGGTGYGGTGYGGTSQPGYGQSEQSGYGKAGSRAGHGGAGYGATAQPGYGQTGGRGKGSDTDRSSSSGYGAVAPARGGAPGYGATGGGGYGGVGGGVPGAKPGVVVQAIETKGVIRPAVVLTGRVPYSKQFDEFQNKFKEAIQPAEGYSAERDMPVYNQFKIERQEVGAGDAKWVALDLEQAVKEEGRWMVQPEQDMVDMNYVPDQILAWPMPPTIGRNWGRLASHPTIPFGWMADASQQGGLIGGAYGGVDDATRFDTRRRDSGMSSGGYGATGGSGGYGATGRGGYGSTGGYGRPGYGSTAFDGGRVRAVPGAAAGADMTGYTDAPLTAHVPSLLFRFVDTQKVEAGKQYRYRVTLELANPNYLLDPAILAEGAASSQKETLLTPPAETATVTVPHDRTLYALSAKVNNKALTDYGGQVLYHIWNPKMGVEIAKEFDLKLGEIAEFVDTVDNWYNPYTGLGEKLENVAFQYLDGKPMAAPMLADITGGEKLPGAKSTDEPQPAEMLFIDANGRMFTANEARDAAAQEYYKERYSAEPAPETEGLFAPEQAAPARGAASPYGGAR